MWISCCGFLRHNPNSDGSKSGLVKEKRTSSLIMIEKTLLTDISPNGTEPRRTDRRSLPDVVIPSSRIPAHRLFVDQRPSLQIDAETGRRPTLDIETTARLAEAESLGPDDYRDLNGQSPRDSFPINPVVVAHSKSQMNPSDTEDIVEPKRTRFHFNPIQMIRKPFARWKIHRPIESTTQQSEYLVRTINRGEELREPVRNDHLLSETKEESGEHSGHSSEDEEEESKDDHLCQLPGVITRFTPNESRTTDSLGIRNNRYNGLLDKFPARKETPFAGRNVANLRRGSLCVFSHLDEPIVTPFAQILASLRRVRSNFIFLTNISSSKDSRFGTSPSSLREDSMMPCFGPSEQSKSTAIETLEELECCLERLENIQTHRSVSDMATSKFRKMLSKELSHLTDSGSNTNQISEYICSTFLDSNENDGTAAIPGGDTSPTSDPIHIHESTSIGSTPNASLATTLASTTTSSAAPTTALSTSTPSNRATFTNSTPGVVANVIGKDSNSLGSQSKSLGLNSTETDDLNSLPPNLVPHGVTSENAEQLGQYVSANLDLWGMDLFKLAELTPNPLTCVFYSIVQNRGLIKRFGIPEIHLIRYMNSVEENYRNVPYHNRVHAADVVQSTHVLLMAPALSVLATDMSKHMSLLADLKTMVETKKVAGSSILTLDNYCDRMQILQNMIHCSDLSNPTKPLELYRKWNGRVMEEHFRQGDRESQLGLDFSPMCDRATASIEKTQVSFIDYIVHPLWETWSDLVHPDAQRILDTLDDNREWYMNQISTDLVVPNQGNKNDSTEHHPAKTG